MDIGQKKEIKNKKTGTSLDNLERTNNLKVMFVDRTRKPDNPVRMHRKSMQSFCLKTSAFSCIIYTISLRLFSPKQRCSAVVPKPLIF